MDTERTLKNFLDRKKKWVLVSVTVAGLMSLLACLIVAGTCTPDMIKSQSLFLEKCASNSTDSCFPSKNSLTIQLVINSIRKKNHFLYYEFYGYPYDKEIKQAMKFKLTGGNEGENYKKVKNEGKIYTIKDSEPIGLFYIPYPKYENYKLELTLNTTDSNLSALKIKINYMEIDYFDFLIIAKYSFLGLTLANIVYFIINAWSIKLKDWQFETTLNFLTCLSLLLYNEPLIGLYTEFFGIGYTAVSVFCNSQFLCFAIIYFIFLLQRISILSRLKIVYFIEILAVAGLFGFYFTLYFLLEWNFIYKEKFNYHNIEDLYLKLFKALIAIIVFISFVLIVYMCLGVKNWIHRDLRYIIYWTINYCMIVLTFVFLGMGYFRLLAGGKVLLSVMALNNIYFNIMVWLATPDKKSYLNENRMSTETDRGEGVYSSKEADNKI